MNLGYGLKMLGHMAVLYCTPSRELSVVTWESRDTWTARCSTLICICTILGRLSWEGLGSFP